MPPATKYTATSVVTSERLETGFVTSATPQAAMRPPTTKPETPLPADQVCPEHSEYHASGEQQQPDDHDHRPAAHGRRQHAQHAEPDQPESEITRPFTGLARHCRKRFPTFTGP
jgi:hypothetical protein